MILRRRKKMVTKNESFRDKFMAMDPTLIDQGTNSLGQIWQAYEHPTKGDETFVYVMIGDVLASSEFFDTEDFYHGSDYEPTLVDNEIKCKFEV